MAANPEKVSRKFDAKRSDPALRRHGARRFSESRAIHEARGAVQSKPGHAERIVLSPPARPQGAAAITTRATRLIHREPSLLTEHATPSKARMAHLRFQRAGARTVNVAGSFNDWQPQRLALNPDGHGGWELDLLLPPGDYEYRFVVDGEWVDDPLACRCVANPFGGVNAILHVHGDPSS